PFVRLAMAVPLGSTAVMPSVRFRHPSALVPNARAVNVGARLAAALLAGTIVAGPIAGPAASTAGQATGDGVAPRLGAVAADPHINPRASKGSLLTHLVYGYLPYWRLDGTTVGSLRYDLLT